MKKHEQITAVLASLHFLHSFWIDFKIVQLPFKVLHGLKSFYQTGLHFHTHVTAECLQIRMDPVASQTYGKVSLSIHASFCTEHPANLLSFYSHLLSLLSSSFFLLFSSFHFTSVFVNIIVFKCTL